MTNDWILDVLADLRAFAVTNGLPQLAVQIEGTSLVAAAELASAEPECPPALPEDMGHAGGAVRTHGERQVA